MKFFTIITAQRVYRVRAKSMQQLTQACAAVGMKVLAYHQDKED